MRALLGTLDSTSRATSYLMGGLAVMPFALLVLGGHSQLHVPFAGEALAAIAFLMTGLESVTAASNDIGAVWFVFNDGELAQIAQAQEMPYQHTACTSIGKLQYEAFATATGVEYVELKSDADLQEGIARTLTASGAGKPVLVNVHIDYSKKTQFTVGTVQTNLKRFDTKNKLRIVGRALKRKFFGT